MAEKRDAQREATLSEDRVEAGLVEEDFEYQAREDIPESIDLESQDEALKRDRRSGAQAPTGYTPPASKQNPYVSEEEQGMEMTPKTFGPPQYGSPDPATAAGSLLTLEDGHPLDMLPEDHPSAISEDYGAVPEAEEGEGDGDDVNATAGAKELAEAEGVNLSEVEGTGEGGRITKADVESHIESNQS